MDGLKVVALGFNGFRLICFGFVDVAFVFVLIVDGNIGVDTRLAKAEGLVILMTGFGFDSGNDTLALGEGASCFFGFGFAIDCNAFCFNTDNGDIDEGIVGLMVG